MKTHRIPGFLLMTFALAATSSAHSGGLAEAPGSLVAVAVQAGGRSAPLYPAPDGSGRYYIEAREGAPYLIRLCNRSGERVGVVLTVDGLNAISGRRDGGRERMYVLDPWGRATVRGWRTSLQEVRHFTFVDEEVSYAARTGQSNSRMGWIEVSVYRERRRWRRSPLSDSVPLRRDRGAAEERSDQSDAARAPSEPTAEGEARTMEKGVGASPGRSYPGTGWGSRTQDPAVLVQFDPEPSPSQTTTLRYEYRDALVALGVLPHPYRPRDRLAERDRGEGGFASPPLW
jgi:hypothetical protein